MESKVMTGEMMPLRSPVMRELNVVTSTKEKNGGLQNEVWLQDVTKESKPDGMGAEGRNNVLHVEDFHKGKGGSISLSRTVSHDEAGSETSDISDDDTDEDISIIQKKSNSLLEFFVIEPYVA